MGRFLRSLFAVVGLIALLFCRLDIAAAAFAPVSQRAANLGAGFAMEMFCLGFVLLLQEPFFPSPAEREAARSNPRGGRGRAGLAVLFGLLHLYPGVSAALVGLAVGETGLLMVGGVILLTALAFIAGGLRALIGQLVAPEALVERSQAAISSLAPD